MDWSALRNASRFAPALAVLVGACEDAGANRLTASDGGSIGSADDDTNVDETSTTTGEGSGEGSGGSSGSSATGDGTGEGTGEDDLGESGTRGTTTVTTSSTSSSSDSGGGCQGNEDCTSDPDRPVCDMSDGTCVGCTPTQDNCPTESYCDADLRDCTDGCLADVHCPQGLVCDPDDNTCKQCDADSDCPLGELCTAGECVAGCSATQPCPGTATCCDGQCTDVSTDPDHCNGCGSVCPDGANASAACVANACELACEQGFDDCDLDPSNGCEVSGSCNCTPNAVASCYTGPAGTEGVGICQAGTRTCNAGGTAWSACGGETKPIAEVCSNGEDDNCNGETDEDADADGDGWSRCEGDCCDEAGENCGNPELVNPGAFDVAGNTVDDDCDGSVDEATPACDSGLSSNSSSGSDYAKAMDLCQTTTANPSDPMDRRWGVIDARLLEADGNTSFNTGSRSIRGGFGNSITPQANSSLVVLSSGRAADSNDTNPNYYAFQTGGNMGTTAGAPDDWLDANGGVMPNAPGCPAPSTSSTVADSMMLRLQVRVPTNANSFSVMMYFFSAEYPEWVCTPFNDFFVALVDSTDPENPDDKNIAVANVGGNSYPVGVNLLKASSGLFQVCENGSITCYDGSAAGTYTGCTNVSQLTGTGFDVANPPGGDYYGYCGSNNLTGGGTGWLRMSGNVTPGEIVTLRFAIWDTSDHLYDSLVLLDDFEWSLQPSDPGVGPT